MNVYSFTMYEWWKLPEMYRNECLEFGALNSLLLLFKWIDTIKYCHKYRYCLQTPSIALNNYITIVTVNDNKQSSYFILIFYILTTALNTDIIPDFIRFWVNSRPFCLPINFVCPWLLYVCLSPSDAKYFNSSHRITNSTRMIYLNFCCLTFES